MAWDENMRNRTPGAGWRGLDQGYRQQPSRSARQITNQVSGGLPNYNPPGLSQQVPQAQQFQGMSTGYVDTNLKPLGAQQFSVPPLPPQYVGQMAQQQPQFQDFRNTMQQYGWPQQQMQNFNLQNFWPNLMQRIQPYLPPEVMTRFQNYQPWMNRPL